MTEFRPIEPNPYIVGNPIRDRTMFFGRQEELRFLRDRLGTTGREIVVLCGGRRSGKTSILLQVLDGRLGERFVPVLVDMQQLAELHSDADLWSAMAGRIADRLGEVGLMPAGSEPPPPAVPDPAAAFRRFLDKATARLDGRKLVVLIDEYELIEEFVQAGTLTTEVTLEMAAILDSTLPVSFIFTGSRRIQERDPAVWSRLMGKAQHRRISFLALSDAERLVREPVRGRMEYADEAVDAILRLTAGHPFYTQVLCQALVDRMNEEQSTAVGVADVDAVAEGIADNPLPQMVYWWKSNPFLTRVVGSILAAAAETPQAFVPAEVIEADLQAHRREYGFEARRASIRGSLEQLVEAEDLEPGERRDAYRFRMDLLRRWLRVEHPVWEVIRDLASPDTDLEGIRRLGTAFGRRWLYAVGAGVAAVLAAGIVAVLFSIGPLLGGEEGDGGPGGADGGPRLEAADAPGLVHAVGPHAAAGADGGEAGGEAGADGPSPPEEVRYSRYFVMKNQLPVPLAEITAEDLGGRTEHFVFTYRGGGLVRFEHRNGSGFPEPPGWESDDWWERSTTLVPEYRADGSVERLTAQRCAAGSTDCKPLAVLLISPDLKSRRAVLPGHEEMATWNENGISVFRFEFDAHGFTSAIRFLNAQGAPQPDRLGRVALHMTRDAEGWVQEVREETMLESREGAERGEGPARRTRVMRLERDARHNVVRAALFDGEGRPVRFGEEGAWPEAHRVDVEWDERDRPTVAAFFGPADEPVRVHGCFRSRTEYDERGNRVRITCLGLDGQPAPDEEEVVFEEYAYNENGLPTQQRFIGRGGLPVNRTIRYAWDDADNILAQTWLDESVRGPDGRPVVVQARAFEYDDLGQRTALRVLDADGKPAAPQGYAVIRYEYDLRGQLLRKTYEGRDGKPVAVTRGEFRGVAEVIREYDDRGGVVAVRYRDAGGRAVNGPDGAADVDWTLDALGRTVAEVSTDAAGRPAALRPEEGSVEWPGSLRRTYRHDGDGNVIEERAYGRDGDPVPSVTGEFVLRREFDRLGRLTAEWYLDADEQPMLGGGDHVARLTRGYAALGPGEACWADESGAVRCMDPQTTGGGPARGMIVETRFFGRDGRPTWSAAHGRGITRIVAVRDTEERLIELRTFGADERPVANRRGVHMVRTRWSDAGAIEEITYGVDGLPIEAEAEDGLRCSRRAWTYDELGHEVEYRTFGADGTPRADGHGVAARIRRYERDLVVDERFVDARGTPHAGAGGVARATWEYDAEGHPIREAFFDASDALFAPEDWTADLRARYDDSGRIVRFELSPPMPLGGTGRTVAAVDINDQGATALAVPLDEEGRHVTVEGVLALRYPKAEWGAAPGCVGLDGVDVPCAEGTEALLPFLTAPRVVSCSGGSTGAGGDRCGWMWSP